MTIPLSRESLVSHSADEAWDALSSMYTGARPLAGSPDARITFDTAASPDVAVDRGYLHTAQGVFDTSPDQLNIITVVDGAISLDFGRHGTIANRARDSYLYLPHSSAELRWESFSALAVRVSLDLVAAVGADLTGIRVDEVRFMSPSPASPALGRLWLQSAKLLWQMFTENDNSSLQPVLHRELVTTMAVSVLTVFPNTTMTLDYLPGPGSVGPASLRRAVDFIDDHMREPIGSADIAAAAGTTTRALQIAFRRHHGVTPTEYLRRARLTGVHRDLLNAEPADGVTLRHIASRWGFTPSARFVEFYRAEFGIHPAETLHRH